VEFFSKIEANLLLPYLFLVNIHRKTVLTVTILLRKVARYILGTSNLALTLIEKTTRIRNLGQLWEAGLFLVLELDKFFLTLQIRV